MNNKLNESETPKLDFCLNLVFCIAMIIALVFFAFDAYDASRLSPVVFSAIAIPAVVYWRLYQRYDIKTLLVAYVFIFECLLFVPYDIRFINAPGAPRFVPYLKGYHPYLSEEIAERGFAVYHGCVVSGFEPKWVFVW